MLSYRILRHAILMVANNLGDVFRISAPMILVAILVPYLLAATFGVDEATLPDINGELAPDGGVAHVAGIGYFLTLFVRIIVTMWVLVAWHRYVLLDEKPRGVVPAPPMDRILAYMGTSALIILASFVGVICVILPATLFASLSGGSDIGMLIAFVLGILVFVLYYPSVLRLSVALPAAAIGRPIGLNGAWEATRGQTMTCLGILLLGTVASIIASIPLILLAYVLAAPFYIVANAVFGVLLSVIGASVLTTLYGYFVQRRELIEPGKSAT